jgi:cellulose 1,4-beta-cellobiosidase
VTLSWTASTGATGYNVKRATQSGGPYTNAGSPTTGTYVDATVSNGTAYFYLYGTSGKLWRELGESSSIAKCSGGSPRK